MKKWIVSVLSVLLLLTASGCDMIHSNATEEHDLSSDIKSHTQKAEISPQDYNGNTVSGGGGYIAEHDDVFYFANPEDHNKLYKKDKLNNIKKLSDTANDSMVLLIQCDGDHVFFVQNIKTDHEDAPWKCTLFDYDLSSDNEVKILEDNICNYTVYEDHIYYSTLDTNGVYVANMDGSDARLICNGGSWLPISLQCSDGNLYYALHDKLVCFPLDGGAAHEWRIAPQSFLVYKQTVYCNLDGTIVKFDASDENDIPQSTDLGMSDVVCFSIFNDLLYYSTSDNDIFKLDLTANTIDWICEGYAPVVLKDVIYYFDNNDKMVSCSK